MKKKMNYSHSLGALT